MHDIPFTLEFSAFKKFWAKKLQNISFLYKTFIKYIDFKGFRTKLIFLIDLKELLLHISFRFCFVRS